MRTRVVGLDTETWLIARAQLAPRLVCVQVAYPGEHGRIFRRDHGAYDVVRSLLQSNHILAIHNAAFDIGVLFEAFPDLIPMWWPKFDRGEVHCTLVRQKLLDLYLGKIQEDRQNTEKYNLQACAAKFGIVKDSSDPWRTRYAELDNVSLELWPPEAAHYAAHDPDAARDLWLAQQDCDDQIKAQWGAPCLHETAVQTESDFNLHIASCWGLRTDKGRVDGLRIRATTQHGEYKRQLLAAGLLRTLTDTGRKHATKAGAPDGVTDVEYAAFLTPEQRAKYAAKEPTADTKAKKRRLWDATAHSPKLRKVTDAGEALRKARGTPLTDAEQRQFLSTDRDACELAGDPLLVAMCDYTTEGGVLNAVAELAEGVDLPLQAQFDVLVATGRTSCRKPMGELKGKQLQNFASDGGVRECCVPRQGYVFLQGDYPGAELHCHAQNCLELFGASALADMLNKGIDPHLKLGARTEGISFDEALRRKSEGDPHMVTLRKRAKPGNFGFPGGMGAAKFVLYSRAQWGVVFTEEEAATIRKEWFTEQPENVSYFEWVKREMGRRNGLLQQFRSGRWRGGAHFTAACNGFFQGRNGDASKYALRHLTRACFDSRTPMHGSRLIAYVHDEFIFETPIPVASDAADYMQRVMLDRYNEWVPLVPIRKLETMLMDTWTKDAKRIVDDKGKVQIFRYEDKLAT